MARDFNVTRLSDEFGQYLQYLKCSECAHERHTYPNLLGPFVRMGRHAPHGGKAPAVLQVRQEALPHPRSAAAKAARNSALPLTYGQKLA
jgi:hypothetical protein